MKSVESSFGLDRVGLHVLEQPVARKEFTYRDRIRRFLRSSPSWSRQNLGVCSSLRLCSKHKCHGGLYNLKLEVSVQSSQGKLGGFPAHAVFPFRPFPFNRFSFHFENDQPAGISLLEFP
jgi:hypothetical protein